MSASNISFYIAGAWLLLLDVLDVKSLLLGSVEP